MNLVFIVHYFPPLNSSGSRRVIAFCKYLSGSGHKITVISTGKRPYDGPLTEAIPDFCHLIELGKRTVGNKSNVNSTSEEKARQGGRTGFVLSLILLRRSLTKVFGQLIDHRIFFATKFLQPSLSNEAITALKDCDVVISSCPPWPVHLAGYIASKRFHKFWVADYRDQFSGNHIFPGNKISSFLERVTEKILLKKARIVTVVSNPMKKYYLQFHNNVQVIQNGFDDAFINKIAENLAQQKTTREFERLSIRYMGTITPDRIPRNFFKAVSELPEQLRRKIIIEFYGESFLLRDVVKKEYAHIADLIKFNSSVPYQQSITLMLTADALLFTETSSKSSLSAEGVLTTKLFEYMATKRPIIADIEAETLIGKIILESGLSIACTSKAEALIDALTALINKSYSLKPNIDFIASFSREAQTKKLETLLKDSL